MTPKGLETQKGLENNLEKHLEKGKRLLTEETLTEVQEKCSQWEDKALDSLSEKSEPYFTSANSKLLYTLNDLREGNYFEDVGFPGEYPFARGIHNTMYRGKLWTMRQFSGFGTPQETNARYQFLLKHGQTGLSVAFDMPTLMGYDSDHPKSLGEVGRCGVAVDTIRDMEVLFNGIPMEEVSTSMTINAPAAIIWAMYLVAAKKQGAKLENLRGTIQNDILKEYIAQKEFIFPPAPSMRLIMDTIEFGTKYVPQWNTISISGYHIREAGATAVQELAFTLADGIAYVESAIERGMDVDSFAPRLSFFFDCHNNFFEEIAKFRAARRIWAKKMRYKFKAKDPRSWLLRFHTQTAGVTLMAQQPENNVVRVAYQALAAVLGGTQSLHTNAMDETLALPTEHAARLALRTQQILAHETGVPETIDPLGGSYYIEALTDQIEAECEAYFDRIEREGGVIAAIEKGFFQKEIARSAYEYQKDIETKKKIIVGVNEFNEGEHLPVEILKITQDTEKVQVDALEKVKEERDNLAVKSRLEDIKAQAKDSQNLMPYFMDAVKEYATLGEIIETLKEVFGEYHELVVF